MRAVPILALLAACAASAPRPADTPNAHAMYKGSRRPPLERMAVLLVLSPPSEQGKTLVGRILSEETGEDFRPPADLRLVELEPGPYRLESYFWIARSHLRGGSLVIENLQSGEIAPIDLVAEEGRTYFIRAEVRKHDEVPRGERGRFFRLNYGATVTDPEQLRRGDSGLLSVSDYVWKPRIAPIPPAQAKEYRNHR